MENAFSERRRHERFLATDDAIAVYNKKIGRIVDISEGGMAVNFISHDEPFSEEGKAIVLCRAKELLIENLQLKVVRKNETPFSQRSRFQIRTVGVEFTYPYAGQRDLIHQYILGLP